MQRLKPVVRGGTTYPLRADLYRDLGYRLIPGKLYGEIDMIPVNTPEEFNRWLEKGPKRNPEAYKRINGEFSQGAGQPTKELNVDASRAIPKPSHKPWMPPPPPKESTGIRRNSTDFKTMASGEDGSWDGEEPEIIE